MASKKAYLEHLRNVSLFQGCSTKDLEKIARASDEINRPAGSLIVDQGQTGREAFVVLEGTVGVKRNGKKVDKDVIYPTVQDGVKGIAFVEACIASSKRNGAWVKA